MSGGSLVPTSFSDFVEIVEGFRAAKLVYTASTLVLVYDFLLCIDREIEFFWSTDANHVTKTLYYLLFEYLTRTVFVLFSPLAFVGPRSSTILCLMKCHLWTRFDFAWTIIALYLAELVLVVRVYNLYSGHKRTRIFIATISILTGGVALVLLIDKLNSVGITKGIPWSFHRITAGCLPSIPGEFWSVFVPIFISETILFGLTLYRLRESLRRGGSSHPLIRCLLMDGTAFYFGILTTVAFSLAGSILTTHPAFSLGALLSNSIVTGCSLAACRLILSIRSLAARLKYDPDAIFNHLELARIYGNGVGKVRKHGQYGSLIVIEVNNGEIELEDMVPSDKAPSEYTVTDVAESVGHAVSNEGHNTKRDSETLGPWAAQGQWRIHGQHH